jgi:hypothetical protein
VVATGGCACDWFRSLCSFTHPLVNGATFNNLNALKRKLLEQHKLHFCDLCIKGRKVRQLDTASKLTVSMLSSSSISSDGEHMVNVFHCGGVRST